MAQSGGHGVRARLHLHGGFVDVGNISHVNAALQALLHVEVIERFLHNDFVHRKQCRTLLSCMICPLFQILLQWQKGCAADTSYFVNKWKFLSSNLTDEEKTSPHNVFVFFLTRMRLDHLNRNPLFGLKEMNDSFITKPYEFYCTIEETCSGCGVNNFNVPQLSVEMHEQLTGNLCYDLCNSLKSAIPTVCRTCGDKSATSKIITINPSERLIINCNRCSPQFQIEFEFTFLDVLYQFTSCLLEMKSQEGRNNRCIFIHFCPDGTLRMFEGAQISVTSPGKLLLTDILQKSKVTLFYKRNSSVRNVPQKKRISRSAESQVVQQELEMFVQNRNESVTVNTPTAHEEDVCNVTVDRETCVQTVTVAVQTEVQTVTVAVQTEPDPPVTYSKCKSNPKFKFWTGLCLEDFAALLHFIGGQKMIDNLKISYNQSTPTKTVKSRLSAQDKLLLFLIRLRRGTPIEELAFIFGISVPYTSQLCYSMTRLIYEECKPVMDEMFVPAAKQAKPPPMQAFKNLRVILDGASFSIQRPSNFQQQGNTYSSYKSCNVLLFVIGISCSGDIIFCSEGFEGSMSDKETVIKSGLLERLEKGDGVMTDRGYELAAELLDIGCQFYRPPCLGGRKQFTPQEEILTKAIASSRIYVEHAIADIKDNRLLQGVIPLTLLPVLDQLVFIAAFLRSFNPSRTLNVKVIGITKDAPQTENQEK